MPSKTLLFFINMLFLLPNGFGQAYAKSTNVDSIDEKLNEVYYQYAKAYRKQNAEMVAELYGEEAFYIFGEKPLIRGQKKIKKHFKKFFKSLELRNLELTLTFKIADRISDQNLNHDIGFYVITYFKKGQPTHQVAGKFSTVLFKGEDGNWRFASDTYHPAHINEFDDIKADIITYR